MSAIRKFSGESPAFAARVFPFKTCSITLKRVTPSTSSSINSRPLPVRWPLKLWKLQRTRF